MRCPRCGHKTWKVRDSRHVDSNNAFTSAAYQRAKRAVGWYTSDFQARKRTCVKCDKTSLTVELPLEDLREMSRLVHEGDAAALRALVRLHLRLKNNGE